MHLQDAFEVVFQEDVKAGARVRKKKHGQVQNMQITENGKVENKTDQVLLMVSTTTQDDERPFYALQARKLTWSELRPDLLAAVKKGLPKQPTLTQRE